MGLAIGPVLIQDGDFYGPVVNLASRVVNIANPGTVLMSDEFHAQLEAETAGVAGTGEGSAEVAGSGDGSGGGRAFVSKALRPRNLKHLGRVQVWNLSRAGTAGSVVGAAGCHAMGTVGGSGPRAGRSAGQRRAVGHRGRVGVSRLLGACRGRCRVAAGATGSLPTVMRTLATRALKIRTLAIPALRDSGSAVGDANGGDSVRTKVEPSLEGGDRTTP